MVLKSLEEYLMEVPHLSLIWYNFYQFPNHFFVTGEKVLYTHVGTGSTNAIGIVTTSVAGVSTDKLPNELYVVKVDDGRLQFETPTKAKNYYHLKFFQSILLVLVCHMSLHPPTRMQKLWWY